MVYNYVVTLKNDRGKALDAISRFLAIISALLFLIQLVRSGFQHYILLVSILLIAGGLIWNWHASVKKKQPVYYSRIILVAGITWFAMPFMPWIGFPLLVLSLLEKQAKFPLEIGFTDERIVFNTLFKRRFTWGQFNNVILKDNLLTLDFKNNKVFQKETIDDDSDADENEFNEYCLKQLAASRQTSPS